MSNRNGNTNGSVNTNHQEMEALKNRLMMLPERAFDRELKKLPPVAVQELLAFTAQPTAPPKKRRAQKDTGVEDVTKPVRTAASVRASLLKLYFDSLSERKLDRELKKLSPEDLHVLVWVTAYQNAQKAKRKPR
jgi:hypothetical protein